MSDFIERVKQERINLDERIRRLVEFIESEDYPKTEDYLLKDQLEVMRRYSVILTQRIIAFNESKLTQSLGNVSSIGASGSVGISGSY